MYDISRIGEEVNVRRYIGLFFYFIFNKEELYENELIHASQEGLVRNTAGEITPGLAENWEVSDDGLTYTFHLREAQWSDGTAVTANDFVFGLQRLMNPETASEYAFVGECVKNGYAVETGKMDVTELGISAPDEKTVVIELENPTAYFLSLIGSAAQFVPLRQDIVEQYGTDFAATQAQVINMLKNLQNELGLTYLFIAHDLSVVKYISDRVIVMYLGTIVEEAPADELYKNPVHPYTQVLLSAIPLADPKLAREKKRIKVQGEIPSPINPGEGCQFAERCPYATDRCRQETPVRKEISKGHTVACHMI